MNLPSRIILIIIFLLASNFSNGQQEPRSSFFWNNYMHTNPAMTGAVYRHHANVQWRTQWTSTSGAPNTLWVNYVAKLDKIHSGVGVSYEYNATGLSNWQTALVSYAYHIPIKNLFLSLGASAGIKSFNPWGMDESIKPVFQSDFGVALHAEKWNVGLSVTQLNGASFRYLFLTLKEEPHIWLFADYAFQVGEKWKLTPRIQSYSDLNQITSSIALIASFKDNLWFGATSSIPGSGGIYAVGPMIGYDIAGKFRLGYTYELNLSRFQAYYPGEKSEVILSSGSHEIILSYQLK